MTSIMKELHGDFDFTLATQVHESDADSTGIERLAKVLIHIPRPRGFAFVRAAWILTRQWRRVKNGVDVLHANGLTEVAVSLPLLLLTGKPALIWVHNFVKPRPYRLVEPLVRVVGGRWTWRAVSPVAAELVAGLSPELLLNPIDATVVANSRTPSDRLRVLYFAGTDRRAKGFDLLPEIIRATHSPKVTWIIYAVRSSSDDKDPRTRAWEALVGDLSPNVEIRGRTSDPRYAYADGDVVLAPSRQESFNRVIAEGLANGLPFVASDIEAHQLLAESTQGGLLFPLTRPQDAGPLIDLLAADPVLLGKLRETAVASASAFDVQVISREMASAWTGKSWPA